MRTIVSTERGGTRKTTFIALLTRCWIKKKSLLGLPEDFPAFLSVKKIIGNMG